MKQTGFTAGSSQFKLNVVKWFIIGCMLFLKIIPAQSQDMSGKQIFDRMLRVYSEANTYQDRGRVQTDYYENGQTQPRFTKIRDFTTAYNRQTARFRFQYEVQNSPEKMVIWSLGANVQTWWTVRDSTSHETSLSDALAIASSVSGTASRKVPGLLLSEPIIIGWGIDSLKAVKLIGRAIQDNRPCYRLTGVFLKNRVAFLWIDQETFLVRRVDETQPIPKIKQQLKVSLTYQPILNQPVPGEALTFEPPRVDKSKFSPTLRNGLYLLLSLLGVGWFIYLRSQERKQSL